MGSTLDSAHSPSASEDRGIQVALVHLLSGRVDQAAAELNAALQRTPASGPAIHLMGRAALMVGETAKAAELFQTALGLKLPSDAVWICACDLSAAWVLLGKIDDAIGILRMAYAAQPEAPELATRLHILLTRAGAADEAALMAGRLPRGGDVAVDAPVELWHLVPGGKAAFEAAMDTRPSPQASVDLGKAFPDVAFGDGVQCIGVSGLRIGRGSAIGDGSWLNVAIRDGNVHMVIGEYVLIGRRAVVSSGTFLEIGSHTIFGPNVYVASNEHEYIGNHRKPILACGIRDHGSLIVEENCWFGMNSIITGGITVGRGSVVGANSVLRDSIPPFSVAIGTPAKVVRMLNPENEQWESIQTDADRVRIAAVRERMPFPDRASYKAQLDQAGGGRPLQPVLAGLGLHLP